MPDIYSKGVSEEVNSMARNKLREKKDREKKGILFDMFFHFL